MGKMKMELAHQEIIEKIKLGGLINFGKKEPISNNISDVPGRTVF